MGVYGEGNVLKTSWNFGVEKLFYKVFIFSGCCAQRKGEREGKVTGGKWQFLLCMFTF